MVQQIGGSRRPETPQGPGSGAEPEWQTGCAFPDGVVHDHGYGGCHQATARLTAQMAVAAFLQGIGRGQRVGVCENAQCRVALFTLSPEGEAGTRVQSCPSCYGAVGGA